MSVPGWSLVRVRNETKGILEAAGEELDYGINGTVVYMLDRIAELEARPRFPLNAVHGDFRDLWGHPLIAWPNGRLYVCQHGALVMVDQDGNRHWLLNDGHACDFVPRR